VISRDLLIGRIQELPTISTSVVRLGTLLRTEGTGASDFEAAIAPDPALTANILRIANSAQFAPRRRITSVRHAVAWLGVRRLYDVVTSAAFQRVLPARLPGYDIEAADFWLHSIAVATLAQQLALELQIEEPEQTFTAGLLHDLGKLAMCSFLFQSKASLLSCFADETLDIITAEQRLLSFDHAAVGGMLAQHWKLPEAVAWAANWHHAPDLAPPEVDPQLIGLIHVADGLAHALGYGPDVGGLARRVDPAVADRFGIRPATLERVAVASADRIQELGQLFAPGGTV